MRKLAILVFAAAAVILAYGAIMAAPNPDSYTLWTWAYGTDNPDWWGLVGLSKKQCLEYRDRTHYRGEAMDQQEADPQFEAHRPVCLPDGRGHPRNARG